jgi:group I intron endonuclease
MEAYIYKITNNENNKIYIGSTKRHVHHRFESHKFDAMKNQTHPLYSDMIGLGFEKFHIEVLEKVYVQNRTELCNIEGSYQEKFNPQYNLLRNISENKIKEIHMTQLSDQLNTIEKNEETKTEFILPSKKVDPNEFIQQMSSLGRQLTNAEKQKLYRARKALKIGEEQYKKEQANKMKMYRDKNKKD